jgi:hypothetical protein
LHRTQKLDLWRHVDRGITERIQSAHNAIPRCNRIPIISQIHHIPHVVFEYPAIVIMEDPLRFWSQLGY